MTTPPDEFQDINHPGLDRDATSSTYIGPPFPIDDGHLEGHKTPGGAEIIEYLDALIQENERG